MPATRCHWSVFIRGDLNAEAAKAGFADILELLVTGLSHTSPIHVCCNLSLVCMQVHIDITVITMPASGIKRIRGACSTCRHRKVRCDAAILDSPCTNCRRNGLFCDTVRPSKERKPGPSTDTSITADITGHLTAIQGRSSRPIL